MSKAHLLRHIHLTATVAWAVMIPVSILTGLRNSIPYLVGISVYALAAAHFAAWQGSRAETNGDTASKP